LGVFFVQNPHCQDFSNVLPVHSLRASPQRVLLEKFDFFEDFKFMTKKKSDSNMFFKTTIILILFSAMGGLIAFKTGAFEKGLSSEGLSGVVSVKGTVKFEDLNLSTGEVQKINRAVSTHKKTFAQVDLFLDAKGDPEKMNGKTVLVWAMVLETNGDCEVRSWSRKISRGDLVPQMVLYMNKAAREYEEFKRFPDVKQNFKCLYI